MSNEDSAQTYPRPIHVLIPRKIVIVLLIDNATAYYTSSN